MKNGQWEAETDGALLRESRDARGITRRSLADELGVSYQTVFNWENGRSAPQADSLKQILAMFGEGTFTQGPPKAAEEPKDTLANWVIEERTKKNWTRQELAQKSGLTNVTIWNIETGRTSNPQESTVAKLEAVFESAIPEDIEADISSAAEIEGEGVGGFTDFDPHDEENLPKAAGVYVFYDVSERPIYVGKSDNIAKRIRDRHTGHWDKFWYRPPIVFSAAYVRIEDAKLRNQIEAVMIKFMKSNAVINQQGVDR